MIRRWCECWNNFAEKLNWLPPLAARLVLGVVFAESGWGKLQHIDKVTAYFESLQIPLASVQAPFVAGCELVLGILILLGLATRLVSVPLSVIMVVALVTAKAEEMDSLSTLFSMSEFLYILLFLYLIFYGAGAISIDHLLCKRCKRGQEK